MPDNERMVCMSVKIATSLTGAVVLLSSLVGIPHRPSGVGRDAAMVSVASSSYVQRVKRARVVRIALAQRGDPYRFGAAGPSRFDCSGLTRYTFRHGAGRILPRTAAGQRARGYWTRRPARGDLVVWGSYHVAIYIGNGRVVHASGPGRRVSVARVWGSPRYKRMV